MYPFEGSYQVEQLLDVSTKRATLRDSTPCFTTLFHQDQAIRQELPAFSQSQRHFFKIGAQ